MHNNAYKTPARQEIYESYEICLLLSGLKATENFATLLAKHMRPKAIITLTGDLGTGKTAFARAFINSFFAVKQEVLSPTFGLVQVYNTPRAAISHYDLYRVKHAGELAELGFEEAFADNITLIEWPQIAAGILPLDRIEIIFNYGTDTNSRMVSLAGYGTWRVLLKEIFN